MSITLNQVRIAWGDSGAYARHSSHGGWVCCVRGEGQTGHVLAGPFRAATEAEALASAFHAAPAEGRTRAAAVPARHILRAGQVDGRLCFAARATGGLDLLDQLFPNATWFRDDDDGQWCPTGLVIEPVTTDEVLP